MPLSSTWPLERFSAKLYTGKQFKLPLFIVLNFQSRIAMALRFGMITLFQQ